MGIILKWRDGLVVQHGFMSCCLSGSNPLRATMKYTGNYFTDTEEAEKQNWKYIKRTMIMMGSCLFVCILLGTFFQSELQSRMTIEYITFGIFWLIGIIGGFRGLFLFPLMVIRDLRIMDGYKN